MRLPDSEDIQRLIPDGTAPVARAGDVSVGSGLQALGGGLNQIADRRASFEVASARSDFLARKVEQDNAYDQDTDFATIPDRYETGVREARDRAAETITNPRARALFMEQTEPSIQAGVEQAQARAFQIEADQGRAKINEQLNALNSAGLSGDPMQALTTMEDLLAGGLEAGYYSAEDAGRLDRAWRDKFATNRVMMLEPSKRLEALQQPWAANLPAEVRIELVDAAREDARRETAVDTLDDMLARGLSMTEMDREIRAIDDLDLRREVEARRDYELDQRTAREAETADVIYEEWGDKIRFGQATVLDIPRDQRRTLTQSHLNALEKLEDAARGAGERDELAAFVAYSEVSSLIEQNKPDEALSLLMESVDKVAPAQLRTLRDRIGSIREEGGELELDVLRGRTQIIDHGLRSAGLAGSDGRIDPVMRSAIDAELDRRARTYQRVNGVDSVPEEWVETTAEELTREIVLSRDNIDWWPGDNTRVVPRGAPAFRGEAIPPKHQAAVVAGFPGVKELSEFDAETYYAAAIQSLADRGYADPTPGQVTMVIQILRAEASE